MYNVHKINVNAYQSSAEYSWTDNGEGVCKFHPNITLPQKKSILRVRRAHLID